MFVLAREEKRARACARVRVCAHVYISLGGFFHAREKMNIGMIIT